MACSSPSSSSSSSPSTLLLNFRTAAATALSAHDRPSFESALQSFCTALPMPLQHLAQDPHLAAILNLAADRQWLTTSEPSPWVTAPTKNSKSKSPRVLSVDPTAKSSSFRKWKWHAGSSFSPISTHPQIPSLPNSPLLSTQHVVNLRHDTHSSSQIHPDIFSNAEGIKLDSVEFEAMLLSGMPRLGEARPAGVAAAAAFRALAPFLPREECVALRQAFGRLPPVDCLAMVVRVAEMASEGGRRGGGGVWGGNWGEENKTLHLNTTVPLDVHAPSFRMGGMGRM